MFEDIVKCGDVVVWELLIKFDGWDCEDYCFS